MDLWGATGARREGDQQFMAQRLTDAVHDVVGLALRKREQFGLELGQECCAPRKMHEPGLKLRLLAIDSANLIVLDRYELNGPA